MQESVGGETFFSASDMMLVQHLKKYQSTGTVPGRTTSIRSTRNTAADIDELIETEMEAGDEGNLNDTVFDKNVENEKVSTTIAWHI